MVIANDWADLLDGSIAVSLEAAEVAPVTTFHYFLSGTDRTDDEWLRWSDALCCGGCIDGVMGWLAYPQ